MFSDILQYIGGKCLWLNILVIVDLNNLHLFTTEFLRLFKYQYS